MTNFKKGDIVRLKTGNAEIFVTTSSGRSIKGYYVKCGMKVNWRANEYFELVTVAKERSSADPYTHRPKYRCLATGVELSYIGMGTTGYLVLENKYGTPCSVTPEDWEKVVPFTLEVKFNGGSRLHYRGTQGDVAVGDKLISESGSECVVVAINTKSNTSIRFVGKRYVLEDLK